jgi:small subunit ribosomal protein S4
MGDPKKPRKKYTRPRTPWRADLLAQELYIVGTYGLRNKRELWKAQTLLSKIRKQARMLLAAPPEIRAKREATLLTSLAKKGLVSTDATLDDVLSLTVENILARRLQTVVWRKGLASTPYQARQLITHRHIAIGDRVVTKPGYLVSVDEEPKVGFRADSPYKARLATLAATPASEEGE